MAAASRSGPDAGSFDRSIVPLRRHTDLELDDDGRLAMYDPAGGRLVVLNESAAALWTQCDGSRDLGTIVDHLGRMFSAHPEELRRDVWATYLHLVELGLVEDARSEPGEAPAGA